MASERALQEYIVQWLEVTLPDFSVVHHSPNEGRRHVNFRNTLKRGGTRWGWPDLEVFVPAAGFWSPEVRGAIFLEVKAPKGRPTDAQTETQQALRLCGCHVAEVRSIKDVESFLAPLLRLAIGGRAGLIRQLAEAAA